MLIRTLRLPLFQAPDVAPAADPAPVDPAVIANADPAPEPAPIEPPVADPVVVAEPEPEPEPKVHGNKGRKPWYLERISEETEGRRQAEERARAAEELALRLQKGNPDPSTPQSKDTDAVVEARARQLADERLAGEKIHSVISAGLSKFDDWEEKAQMLGAVGAATPTFVLDVVAVDPANAHEILHNLAEDPQKAQRIAKMDSRSRTVELVKMSMAISGAEPQPTPKTDPKPAPKTVSKAPAPPPAIEPTTSQVVDWRSDKASDEEFSKGWEETQRLRAARGRR